MYKVVITISIIGKFDFQDECEMGIGADKILEKYRVFVGRHELVPLWMNSKKDLVAYYTYTIGIMASDKHGGMIVLSDESYIDSRERERISQDYKDVLKYYRKCKREKKEFDKTEALRRIAWLREEPDKYQVELVDRFSQNGPKVTINDLHAPMFDMMRKEWYDLMLKNGWSEQQAYRWVYGWRRWLDREGADKSGQYKLDLEEDKV